jgi:hypothetical protein
MLPALVLFLILLLVAAGSASAGTRRDDRLTQIVAAVAGRAVDVSCETSTTAWVREITSADVAAAAVAYYDPNLDLIRLGPLACNDLIKPMRGVTPALVRGLFIAAHEAAHATGIEDEGVANCWALYWAQDLARRFAGVPFFTPQSTLVRTYARQIQRDSPPEYRAACPV